MTFTMPDTWYDPPDPPNDGVCVACGDWADSGHGTMATPLCRGCNVDPMPPPMRAETRTVLMEYLRTH